MFAVIRTGGKQYRVAPGDIIRVERTPATDGVVEFNDILAVSGQEGQAARPQNGASVTGTVMEEGRADKILVFHYKRKKQYKKLRGHRQPFTAVRITEIAFDGQKFSAPELPKPQPKAAKPRVKPAAAEGEHEAEAAASAKKPKAKAAAHKAPAKHAAAAHKKAAPKKAAHKAAPKKGKKK